MVERCEHFDELERVSECCGSEASDESGCCGKCRDHTGWVRYCEPCDLEMEDNDQEILIKLSSNLHADLTTTTVYIQSTYAPQEHIFNVPITWVEGPVMLDGYGVVIKKPGKLQDYIDSERGKCGKKD